MKEEKHTKKTFGLIGKNISYSFSRKYFTEKFNRDGLEKYEYLNFDIDSIDNLKFILEKHKNNLKGMNVTIPYKENIISKLKSISEKARIIGAVNTIKTNNKGELIGYNTDEYGFRHSLQKLLQQHHQKALILGTGGASKAVAFSLTKLGISYKFVSRTAKDNVLSYLDLNKEIIDNSYVIINCTPLGTFPNTDSCPDIPYQYLTNKHLLYDLIYNPTESLFLSKGKEKGCIIKNGHEMLHLQAEKSWEIWNGELDSKNS